jgi:hypothetical protein
MAKGQKRKNKEIAVTPNQFFLYKDNSGRVQINALFSDETLWLTQKAIAELFEVKIPAISKHIKNIITDGELMENQVISKMEITAADGKNYNTAFYNLDMIIAVGYRINSKKATAFRIWATEVLREYIVKGFALDDERLHGKEARTGALAVPMLLSQKTIFNKANLTVYWNLTVKRF